MGHGDADYERFADVIGDAMAYALSESLIFARLEEFFDPKPASLAKGGDIDALQNRVDRAITRLGGPPRSIIRGHDEPPPTYDTYAAAAMDEVLSAFRLARRTVCRAHTFMIGCGMIRTHPEIMRLPEAEEVREQFLSAAERAFWEHTETAFINICCYWDRVGQILDFAYFGIRQFERDGFTAVVDRIHANAAPMRPELQSSLAWVALRRFQNSEKDDGLKWLLRRRNLIVHSLHLRPIRSAPDEELFKSAYNHLEVKLASKLAPRSPIEEVEQLNLHLTAAADLFPNLLAILEFSPNRAW